MIGRGALAQPWIFRDTAHYLATGELSQPLPRSDRVRMVLEHFDNLLHYRGERVALRTMTQRISRYSPHLQPWPKLRHDARRIDSAAAFREFLLAGIERIEVDDRELAAV
jgi:tRNA-dihydrouridine synthase B